MAAFLVYREIKQSDKKVSQRPSFTFRSPRKEMWTARPRMDTLKWNSFYNSWTPACVLWSKTVVIIKMWIPQQNILLGCANLFPEESCASWMLKCTSKSRLKVLKVLAIKGQLSCWQTQPAAKRTLFIDLADRNLQWHFSLLSILKSPGLTLQLSVSKAQSNGSFWYSARPAFWGPLAGGIV